MKDKQRWGHYQQLTSKLPVTYDQLDAVFESFRITGEKKGSLPTPLLAAVQLGSVAAAERLVDAGAERSGAFQWLIVQENMHKILFHQPGLQRVEQLCQALVRAALQPGSSTAIYANMAANSLAAMLETMAWKSCKDGHSDVLAAIIPRRQDVVAAMQQRINANGNSTSLAGAIVSGKVDIARVLVSAGLRLSLRCLDEVISSWSRYSTNTALALFLKSGAPAVPLVNARLRDCPIYSLLDRLGDKYAEVGGCKAFFSCCLDCCLQTGSVQFCFMFCSHWAYEDSEGDTEVEQAYIAKCHSACLLLMECLREAGYRPVTFASMQQDNGGPVVPNYYPPGASHLATAWQLEGSSR